MEIQIIAYGAEGVVHNETITPEAPRPVVTVPTADLRVALQRAGKIAEDVSKSRYYNPCSDKPGLTHLVYLRTVSGFGTNNKRILQVSATNRALVATSNVLTTDAVDLPDIHIDQRRIAGVVKYLRECGAKTTELTTDADGDLWICPGVGNAKLVGEREPTSHATVCVGNHAKDAGELAMSNIEKMFDLGAYPANGCAELDKVAVKQLKDLVRPSKGAYDNRTAIRFETDAVLGVFADKSGAGEIVGGTCSRIDELRILMVKSGSLWKLLQCVDTGGVRLGFHRSVCGKNGMTGADRYMDALTAVDGMTRVLCVADDRTHEVTGEDTMPKAA